MKTATITSLALGAVLVAGTAIFLATNRGAPPNLVASSDSANVSAVGDPGQAGNSQVIEIVAKGGYTPKTASARAGVPVSLKIKTDGTLDCSASVRIPSLGWSRNLSPTGEVAVQIPAQRAGTTLVGVCSMGMYNFKITFD